MGVLAKAATRRQVQPQPVQWKRTGDASEFIDTSDELYLCVLAAAFGQRVSTTSDWSGSTGRRHSADVASTTSASMLQVEGGLKGSCSISLGAPSPACEFVRDWRLRIVLDESDNVTLDVPAYRTSDGSLENKSLFKRLRNRVGATLASGESHFEINDGVPELSDLLVPMVLERISPFQHDYLPAIPHEFCDGARITFPEVDADAFVQALESSGINLPEAKQKYVTALDVSAGTSSSARIVLARTGPTPTLELVLPGWEELSPLVRHRLYRSCLRALRATSNRLEPSSPIAEPINAFITRSVQPGLAEDRADRFSPLWSEDVSARAVPLIDSTRIPVGILVESESVVDFNQVISAERALAIRHRTWSRGFRKATREKNRIYTCRRPAVLAGDSGGHTPYLRYAQLASCEPDALFKVDVGNTWFWEVRFRQLEPAASSANRALLLADGVATAHGVLAYGPELFALYRAWVAVIEASDPSAQFKTLCVRPAINVPEVGADADDDDD